MKLPRDISGKELIKVLSKHGYQVTRQKGSHIRLTRVSKADIHHITIPNHDPIRIGTLASIVNDICNHLGISKEDIF